MFQHDFKWKEDKAPEKHRLQEAIMGYQRIPPKPIFKGFRHDIKLLYQQRLFQSEVGKSNRDIRTRGSCPPRGLKATSTGLSTKGRQGAKGAKGGQQNRMRDRLPYPVGIKGQQTGTAE